jgi:hypothetical protein
MKASTIRFVALAALLVAGIGTFSTGASAQQTRLRVRKNKVINGVEAQLRGDYRESSSPISLSAELEDINIPVGTKVAFCLLRNGATTLIGVGKVAVVGGIRTATVELKANDGDMVPNVDAGNALQARQRILAPFNANPTCNSPLMITGAFQ